MKYLFMRNIDVIIIFIQKRPDISIYGMMRVKKTEYNYVVWIENYVMCPNTQYDSVMSFKQGNQSFILPFLFDLWSFNSNQ